MSWLCIFSFPLCLFLCHEWVEIKILKMKEACDVLAYLSASIIKTEYLCLFFSLPPCCVPKIYNTGCPIIFVEWLCNKKNKLLVAHKSYHLSVYITYFHFHKLNTLFPHVVYPKRLGMGYELASGVELLFWVWREKNWTWPSVQN